MSDIYGYKPGMSRIYGLFASNPFGAYAFLGRHHPAVRACIDTIVTEIANDGLVLISEKGTSKKRLREVWRKLKENRIPELRLNLCKHLKLYGNAWILKQNNLLGGKGDLMLLSPPRVLPDIDPASDKIVGWLYKPGPGGYANLPLEKVYHLKTMSMDDYRPLGDPPLSPAILDIEADLAASAFNNQVFQKGGLLGLIISVKTPDSGDPFDDDELDAVEDLQDRVNDQFSGAKAGQSILVSNNIENVYNPSPIGKLDTSFKTLHYETAKTIATCLGVPPEKIAVSRSDTLQYIPSLVEDSVNTSFDKVLNALTSYVDEFINERILKEQLKISDVRIQAGGRYGSLTKNAADVIKTLAEAGPIITVNDALERILGWEPLSGDHPRAYVVLDNTDRSIESRPPAIDPAKDDLNFGKSMSSEAFISMALQIKSGVFERRDKTHAPDDSTCHRAIINKWGVKFYEDISQGSGGDY